MTSSRLHSSNHHYHNTTHFYCPWCTDPVLCARKFLFVVATGRSGSTTVMGMLNGVPGIFISGENFGEMGLLRQLYIERALTRKEMIKITRQFPATTNQADNNDTTVDHAELLAIQAWIWEANLPPPSLVIPQPEIVGFKEIRWTAEDVAFAQRACPCSRFVFNARKDVKKQAQSSFYGKSATPLQDVERANERLRLARRAVSPPPERTFTLYLEDFSVTKFNELAREWLGFDQCRFRAVLHTNADGTMDAGSRLTRCL